MDLFHYWGSDLQLSATGDLLTIDGVTETNQRILRGLMTANPEYVFHVDYGAGIGKHVGDALSTQDFTRIKSAIRGLVMGDINVASTPAPSIEFQATSQGLLMVSINYTYKPTGQLQSLTFNVGK